MSQDLTILIDDSDPNIQYNGPWFSRTGVITSTSGNGPAYLGSQHGIRDSGSISYIFNGTQIAVIGAAYNISESKFPSWTCLLDGVDVGEGTSFDTMQARQQLCFIQSLDPSIPHTINVTIQGNENQAFLFDYFQYIPPPSAPLENVVIRLESNHSSLAYNDRWQDSIQQAGGKFTTLTNTSLSLPFTGNSLTWWGSTTNDSTFSSIPAKGSYTVDGSQPIYFEIPTLPSTSSLSQSNEKYFDTGPLGHDKHNLVVTYHGSEQTVPFTLNYLLIQTGNDVPPQLPTLAGLPSTDSSLSQCSSSSKNMTSYIVGGVLGGLIFIALLVIAIVIYLRRRRRAIQQDTAKKSYSFRLPGATTQSSMSTISISRRTDRSWTTSTRLTLTDVITEGTASTNRSYSIRGTATDSSKPASQATMYTAGRSTTTSEGGYRNGSVC